MTEGFEDSASGCCVADNSFLPDIWTSCSKKLIVTRDTCRLFAQTFIITEVCSCSHLVYQLKNPSVAHWGHAVGGRTQGSCWQYFADLASDLEESSHEMEVVKLHEVF